MSSLSRSPINGRQTADRRAHAEALVEANHGPLRREVRRSVAAKLRDKLVLGDDEFDELYNASWFALYRTVLAGEDVANLAGWLVQAIEWRAFEEARRRDSRPKLAQRADFEESAAVVEPDYAAEADERVLLRRWRTALRKRLKPQERQAAALRVICGYSRDEIATILGVDRKKTDKLLDAIQVKTKGLLEALDGSDACEEHHSLITAYALGVLDPEGERFAVARQHVLECPACAATVRTHRNLCILVPVHALVGVGVASGGGLLGFLGGVFKGSGAGTASIGVGSAGAGTAGGMLGGGLGTVGGAVCVLCAGVFGASALGGSGDSNAAGGRGVERPAIVSRAPASTTILTPTPAITAPTTGSGASSTSSRRRREEAPRRATSSRPTGSGAAQEFSFEAPSAPSSTSVPSTSAPSSSAPDPAASAPTSEGGEFGIER